MFNCRTVNTCSRFALVEVIWGRSCQERHSFFRCTAVVQCGWNGWDWTSTCQDWWGTRAIETASIYVTRLFCRGGRIRSHWDIWDNCARCECGHGRERCRRKWCRVSHGMWGDYLCWRQLARRGIRGKRVGRPKALRLSHIVRH